jgi:hypothetical protein
MLNPLVLVLPRQEVRGAGSLTPDQPVQLFEFVPIRTALETFYETDAHHTLYFLPDQDRCPRINKGCEADLIAAGQRMLYGVTALDVDTPGHTLAPPDFLAETLAKIKTLPPPTAAFKTQHGARLLYFHESLESHEAESLRLTLMDRAEADGISGVDRKCKDSSRLFRLPNVNRDGRTLRSPVLWGPDLVAASIPRTRVVKPLCVKTLTLAQPPEVVRDLVIVPKGKGSSLTEWAKEARSRLGERMDGHLKPLFETNPPPIPEPRNDTIMAWMGCAAAVLSHLDQTTPEHLYGLFLGAAHNAAKPTDADKGRDLTAELWKITCYCWAREQAKREAEREEQANLFTRIERAVRQWPDPPNLPHDARSWIKKRLIVSVSSKYYVMQADGQYSQIAHPSKHLFPALRDSGLAGEGGLIDLYNEEGGYVSEATLLNDYHTCLDNSIDLTSGPGRAWIVGDRLRFSVYRRRTDIGPAYSEEVDEWLKALGGDREYKNICQWIGLALAIERGPTCALSIVGPPGSGKQMLADGLGECFTTECVARASDFGKYQYGIVRSPVIVVDEGWPENVSGIADTFRHWVAGTTIEVNQKNEPIKLLKVNPRFLLTANNDSVARELFARKQMDWADQGALAARLHHITIDDAAANYLKKKGGRSGTNGWVKGDVPSRYTVAKHFLWLYKQHGQAGGAGRFLFEGKSDPAVLWAFGASADGVSEVGQALSKCVLYKADKGGMWVKLTDVQTEYDAVFERKIPLQKVAKAMRPFLMPSKEDKFRFGGERMRGRQINLERLRQFADESGLPMPKIRTAEEARASD